MTVRLFGSALGNHVPNSVLGVTKLVCQTPSFFAMILAMLDFQPTVVFQMAATLCDGVDTLRMVTTLVKDSQVVLFSQPQVNETHIINILVNHLPIDLPMGPPFDGLFVGRIPIGQPPIMVVPPWHVIIAKFQELPTHPPIDQTGVIFDVMGLQNHEGVF
jgi:hypothetical protein